MALFVLIILFWKAGIAQLVEYKLPKLGVASSNLVARSSKCSFPFRWLGVGLFKDCEMELTITLWSVL